MVLGSWSTACRSPKLYDRKTSARHMRRFRMCRAFLLPLFAAPSGYSPRAPARQHPMCPLPPATFAAWSTHLPRLKAAPSAAARGHAFGPRLKAAPSAAARGHAFGPRLKATPSATAQGRPVDPRLKATPSATAQGHAFGHDSKPPQLRGNAASQSPDTAISPKRGSPRAKSIIDPRAATRRRARPCHHDQRESGGGGADEGADLAQQDR
jgi:hypothetical protein